MPIILRIAVRNLKEHKVKSLIIISLIALGMIMLVLGNAVIDTGKAGIEKSFIQTFSGHILVGPKGENDTMPSLLGAPGMGGSSEVNTIPAYKDVLAAVNGFKGVKVSNPQVTGVLLGVLEGQYRAGIQFMGVDPDQYQKMFPGAVVVEEGHFLAADEEGIVLARKVLDDITKNSPTKLKLGDKLKVQAFGGSGGGSKIKELPIVGIFHFDSENSTMQELSFMDVNSLRYMKGLVVGSTEEVKVDAGATELLGGDFSSGTDSFFGDDTVVSSESAKVSANLDIYNVLGDTSNRAALAKADAGAWMYLLVRLEDGSTAEQTIKAMNEQFTKNGWDIVAVDWQTAAGTIATFVNAVQIFFFILVMIITVVSVIVIMNTMVVSIMERTGEIGTMRALGARKSYIRMVFMAETFTVSLVGGIIGLILGMILIGLFNVFGLPAPNAIFELVFGGKILHPVITAPSALSTLIIMVVVGLVSGLYPTALALRIQPIKAMQST